MESIPSDSKFKRAILTKRKWVAPLTRSLHPIARILNVPRKANTKRTFHVMLSVMDEGRRRVLWICATILAARKLARELPGESKDGNVTT